MPFINSPTLCVAVETNSEVTSNGLILFQTLVVYVPDETYLNDSGWVFTRFPQHPDWSIEGIEVTRNETVITLFMRNQKSRRQTNDTYIKTTSNWEDPIIVRNGTVTDDVIQMLKVL